MSDNITKSNPFPILTTARQPIALSLIVGAVLLLIAGWVFGDRGLSQIRDRLAKEKASNEKLKTPEQQQLEPKEAEETTKKTYSEDYLPLGVWSILMAVALGGSAYYLLTTPTDQTKAATQTRMELMIFGATIGLLTATLGFVYSINWFSSLTEWLSKGNTKEAKWIGLSQLILFAGLTLMFFSTQLGRAEQRNSVLLRRVMYGFNAVFQGILIVYVLIGLNIFVFAKVPTTLVVNDTAFTELQPESKAFLSKLNQKVNVYLILPEGYVQDFGAAQYGNLYVDCVGLLRECEDHNRNFEATILSPTLDKARINTLYEQVKLSDRDQFGMLIVTGENQDAVSFINVQDLLEVVQVDRSQQIVFQGQNKLISELAYLTDAQAKSVIYVTQDHGELSISAAGEGDRSMANFVAFLKSRKLNVEPLKLDDKSPKIPDNAALVIIAGPDRTISPTSPLFVALSEYLQPTKPGAKPGKLLALLPAFRGPDGKVAPTGLESLLNQAGIASDEPQRLLTSPTALDIGGRFAPPECMYAAGLPIDHPLAESVINNRWLLMNNRVFKLANQSKDSKLFVVRLLNTPRGFQTWRERDYATPPAVAWEAIKADKLGPVAKEKFYSEIPQPLMFVSSVVTDETNPERPKFSPRMVVFASDTFASDRSVANLIRPETQHQVLADCVDYLREREATIGIQPRLVPIYKLPKAIEFSNKLSLLGMVVLGVAALGTGVWYSRRR